jgi:hypothetical protein
MITAMGITAVGVAGIDDQAADPREAMAVRRKTGLRYLDPLVERGVRAIEAATAEGDPSGPETDLERAFRTGILMVTRQGPSSTREQLYRSLSERQGKGVSATLFSNCGYNIAAAVMAKVRGIRGPSLTFAATPGWAARVFRFADGLFARRAADRLFLSYADGNAAIVLLAEPWEQVERRTPTRALRLVDGLSSTPGKPGLAIGLESELDRAGAESGGSVSGWRRVPLRLPDDSPGLALDQTFLSIAWLWEAELARRPRRLEMAIRGGVVSAVDPSDSAPEFVSPDLLQSGAAR